MNWSNNLDDSLHFISMAYDIADILIILKSFSISFARFGVHDETEKWSLALCRVRDEEHSEWQFTLEIYSWNMLIDPFHFSNLLQIQNDRWIFHTELLGNFSSNCERIYFGNCSQLARVYSQCLLALNVILSLHLLHVVCPLAAEPKVLLLLEAGSLALEFILNSSKN